MHRRRSSTATTVVPPRRRWVAAVVILLAALVLVGGLLGVARPGGGASAARDPAVYESGARTHAGASTQPQPSAPTVARAEADATPSSRREHTAGARASARAQRDALHRRILARRAGEAAKAPATDARDAPVPSESAPLRDRIGGRDALVQQLQRDFIPLADECIAMATEREPTLRGTIALEFDVLGDDELGAVIEDVRVPDRRVVDDPADAPITDAELIECMRESAWTVRLPPPPAGGRDAFMVSLRVGDDAAAPG